MVVASVAIMVVASVASWVAAVACGAAVTMTGMTVAAGD